MIEDPEIDRLRLEIDRIDHELLRLLRERASVVLSVGDRKREQGLSVYDPKREQTLLGRLSEEAESPLDAAAVTSVFQAVVQECRRLEEAHVDPARGD